jgi:uncharacterized protein (TIGR00725 family)
MSEPSVPLKFGIMGGASGQIPHESLHKAEQVGEAVAEAGCIVITGACPGLPLAAACGAKRRGGLVVGISPALSLDEHAFKYESPTLAHDVLIFTGSGLMGREVVNIRSSDVVVIIGGSSGSGWLSNRSTSATAATSPARYVLRSSLPCLRSHSRLSRAGRERVGAEVGWDMTSSFPRLLAAWLGVRVANRKKVR